MSTKFAIAGSVLAVIMLSVIASSSPIFDLQGGPSVNSFTVNISDTNRDGAVTQSDMFSFSCSASDSTGLKYISVEQAYPTGGKGTWSPSTPNGYLDNPKNYTFSKSDIGTVLWTSLGKEGGVPGVYTFKCTVTNSNGSKAESEVKSVNVQGCSPSTEGSCKTSDDCTGSGGKWCTGGTYINSYCEVSSSICTPSNGSACGNGVCDKGEYFSNQQYQGSNMCPKDCGSSTPTPSGTCGDGMCSSSESKYSCSKDCGLAIDRCNSGQGNGVCESGEDYENCWKDCPKGTKSCNVDPYQLKSKGSCESAGCTWCSQENVCKASTGGPPCASSAYIPPCNENGKCDSGESQTTCSIDCGVSEGYANGCPDSGTKGKTYCGDGSCNINCNVQEDWYNCYKDCTKQNDIFKDCGDSKCQSTESELSCSIDCGISLSSYPDCGDDVCSGGEDYWNCWKDCPKDSSKPTYIPSKTPDILVSEIIQITEPITIGKPVDLEIPSDIAEKAGITGIKIYFEKEAPAGELSVDVKSLASIPSADESGNRIKLLENQQVAKVIQFTFPEALSDSIKEATINFALTGSEMAAVNLEPSDVALSRFYGGAWNDLKTEYLGQDASGNHMFKSITPGFSVFVVTKKSEKVEAETKVKEKAKSSCKTDSDCNWYSANGCPEGSGAIWKCGSVGAENLFASSKTKCQKGLYVSKPKPESCGCVESKCAPVEIENRKTERGFLKSKLFDALMIIDQFKSRFDYLSKRAGSIANYHLLSDDPQGYTKWLTASDGFSEGAEKFDSLRQEIKSVKDNPTREDVNRINREIDSVVKILDTTIDFILKDVLDVGVIKEVREAALAVGQSIKFMVNGEEHTIELKAIENGKARFIVSSIPQPVSLSPGDGQNMALAEVAAGPDTRVSLDKIEKNVVYIRLNSLLTDQFASAGEVECTVVGKEKVLASKPPVQSCYIITENGTVFDGGGQIIDGGGLSYAIYSSDVKGITIKNVTLVNFISGIKFVGTNNSLIINANISSLVNGIDFADSWNNTISKSFVMIKNERSPITNLVSPEDLVAIEEVVLYDGPNGGYVPYISMVSNTESTQKDMKGNPLETTDFDIEVEDLKNPGKEPSRKTKAGLRLGQKTMTQTSNVVYPDKNDDVEIKITISALGGSKTQTITKKMNVKDL